MSPDIISRDDERQLEHHRYSILTATVILGVQLFLTTRCITPFPSLLGSPSVNSKHEKAWLSSEFLGTVLMNTRGLFFKIAGLQNIALIFMILACHY